MEAAVYGSGAYRTYMDQRRADGLG
jgi:hypothetical protein